MGTEQSPRPIRRRRASLCRLNGLGDGAWGFFLIWRLPERLVGRGCRNLTRSDPTCTAFGSFSILMFAEVASWRAL